MKAGNGRAVAAAKKVPTTTSMSKELLRKVALIAAHRDLNRWQVLDKYAGPAIDKEYQRCLDEGQRVLGESGA